MKIFLDARNLAEHSGIGRYLKEVLHRVYKLSGSNVNWILGGDPVVIKSYVDAHKLSTENIEIVELSSKMYSPSEQLELVKKVPHVDIFWTPHFNVPIFKIPSKKRLVTIMDVFHVSFSRMLSLPKRLYAKFLYGRAVKLSDSIMVISKFTQSELEQFFLFDNSKVVVTPLASSWESEKLLDFEMIAQKYNIKKPYILCVGNVKPHKNIATLIKAFKKIAAQNSDLNLVIVGKQDGFLTADDKSLSEVLSDPVLKNRVMFTGFVDDVDLPSVYANAKVFVAPSLYEGFGITPLDAMKLGIPVICSDIAPHKEVCEAAAYYFEPLDETDLADKLQKLLSDETARMELSKKAFEQATKFSWDKTADQTYKVIKNLYEQN